LRLSKTYLCQQAHLVLQIDPLKKGHVFHSSTLLDSAIAIEKGHWFIINHHDDNNTNTLASILGLHFADIFLLKLEL